MIPVRSIDTPERITAQGRPVPCKRCPIFGFILKTTKHKYYITILIRKKSRPARFSSLPPGSLDKVLSLDLASIDRMRMHEDGHLVTMDAAGNVLWSASESGAIPGSRRSLLSDGTLQIVTPDFATVIRQNR